MCTIIKTTFFCRKCRNKLDMVPETLPCGGKHVNGKGKHKTKVEKESSFIERCFRCEVTDAEVARRRAVSTAVAESWLDGLPDILDQDIMESHDIPETQDMSECQEPESREPESQDGPEGQEDMSEAA